MQIISVYCTIRTCIWKEVLADDKITDFLHTKYIRQYREFYASSAHRYPRMLYQLLKFTYWGDLRVDECTSVLWNSRDRIRNCRFKICTISADLQNRNRIIPLKSQVILFMRNIRFICFTNIFQIAINTPLISMHYKCDFNTKHVLLMGVGLHYTFQSH